MIITLTLDEHVQAHFLCEKFANRRMLVLRWFLLVPMYAGFCLGVVSFLRNAINGHLTAEWSDLAYLGPLGAMIAMTFWSRLALRGIRRRLTAAYDLEQRNTTTLRISNDGYYSDFAINEQHSFEWSEFDRYLETRSIFALVKGTRFFPNPDFVFFPIPKHVLTKEQQSELHDFLKSNYVKFRKKSKKHP